MYKQIISSTQVSTWAAGTPSVSVGTVQGCSIKLINQTQYELQVFNGTEQIDTVPPFSFIVSPYENDLNVSIDKSNASVGLVSPYQYVAFKRINGVVSYQTGSTTFPGNTPVAGTVDVSSGTLNVGSVNSITDNVNSQVVNDYIVQSPMVKCTAQTMPSTTLVPNETVGFMLSVPMGFYDAAQLYVDIGSSPNGTDGVTFYVTQTRYQTTGGASYTAPSSQLFIFPYYYDNQNTQCLSSVLPFNYEMEFNEFYINIVNTNTVSITIEFIFTLYLRYASQQISNSVSTPVPTQSQYSSTTYNLGSYTFGSTAVPAQSVGASQFTGSVPMTNVIKAQLLVQQTASSGFVDANPGAGIGFQLQGSNDNSTWYVIAGDANNPTSMDIINNGVWYQAADQTAIPALISGYAYIRWAIYLVNGTAASVTMSESCTVYMQTLEG